jgi:hypothetical protein
MEAGMREGTGNAAVQATFHPPHVVSHLSGAAARFDTRSDDRLAIIEMPQAESRQFSIVARHLGWRPGHWHDNERSHGSNAFDLAERHAGTFFSGQILHSETAIAALAGHRKVLLVRELRSTLVSCLRSEVEQLSDDPQSDGSVPAWRSGDDRSQMYQFLRQHGPSLFGQFLSILTWMAEKDVTILRVEDLLRPDEMMVDRLIRLLHIDGLPTGNFDAATFHPAPRDDARADAAQAFKLGAFWSNETENLFSAFGGCLWNKALGYDRPTDDSNDRALG